MASTSTPLLEVQGLTVTYGAVLALDNVSLTVPDRGCVALLGANGAGKSTVLRAITGLLRFEDGTVNAGDIRFEGQSILGMRCPQLVELGIAQCLEGRRIFQDLTVDENLKVGAFAPRARGREAKRRDVLLRMFPRLAERLQQRGGLLSGGEQQMLAIARALMAQPRLLILDEPSLGLAPLIVTEIGQALRRVVESGTAVLLVDQGTALALKATDHAYLLEVGQMKADGPTSQLLSDDKVRASYLGMSAGGSLVRDEVAEVGTGS